MATEGGLETARRRRFKSSTASVSKPPEENVDSSYHVAESARIKTSRRRDRLDSTQNTLHDLISSRDQIGLHTQVGRGRLRDAVIMRSKMTIESKINKGLPLTLEDQANFFYFNWDGIPRRSLWPGEIAESQHDEEENSEDDFKAESAPLVELKLRKDALHHNGGVTITSRNEQLVAENTVLMLIPSGEDLPLPQGDDVRLLEDEGFYMGERPAIAQRNFERMRERLLKQSSKERISNWFDEGGYPLALPDPLRVKELRILPSNYKNKSTVYRKAVSDSVKRLGEEDDELFRLNISIGHLQYSHHHLFNFEQVLADKLCSIFKAYADWQSRDLILYWRQQLNAVRLALSVLMNEYSKRESRIENESEAINFDLRNSVYLNQVHFIRRQLNTELAAEFSFIRGLLNAWRKLKDQRKSAGYNTTGWKLDISRMVLSSEEIQGETEEWQRDINEESEEIFKAQMQNYEKRSLGKIASSANNENANRENEIVVSKPEFEVIREQVIRQTNSNRRKPGVPKLTFDLQHNGVSVTPIDQLPKQEQNRRHDVMRTNAWLKLVIGSTVLSETSRRPIGSEFSVDFEHTFPVVLSELPESIAVEIYESSMSKLATVYVPIPDASCISNRPFTSPFEFTCPSERPPASNSTAVGSGLSFDQELVTGSLNVGAAWDPDALPPPRVTQALTAMNSKTSKHITDASKIRDMISSGALDPNHPNNAELVYLLRSSPATGTAVSPASFFRLQHLQNDFSFISDEEFARSNRFRMLELRDKEIDEFRKMKMVPPEERDIDVGVLRRYDKRLKDRSVNGEKEAKEGAAEFDLASQTAGGFHEFEMKRQDGAKQLQEARENVMRQLNIAAHKLNLADVVFEDEVPSIRTGLEAMARIFEPKRPLMPKRITRKKIPGQNLQPGDVHLLISVLRAHINESSPLGMVSDLRVYAEVTFQERTQETTVAMGRDPTWNEKMKFEFRAPNDDFSPSSLQTANDYIYISIFARRNKMLSSEERGDASVVTQRFERRWLGTLKLRWSAVYLNTTIDGTFYVPQIEPSLIGTNQLSVSVYATLTPALLLPDGVPPGLPTSEEYSLVQRAEIFNNKFISRFPNREALVMVTDITGKQILVSRYLKRLKPPHELTSDSAKNVTDRKLARFVSLIPFVSDMSVFPVQIDVWATVEQFLGMLSGDDEEHSCLLASYMLALGRTAYLAVGTAIPEGRSTYAISQTEEGKYVVWDPKNGLHYPLADSFCPLQTVDCIIAADNVFANVQSSNRLADINMDLANKKMWEPFFNQGEFTNEAELEETTQDDEQTVKGTEEAAGRLKIIIRDRIHKELGNWRGQGRNALNRSLSHRVQDYLRRLELQYRDGSVAELGELTAEFERYGVNGFTLQQPFTTVQAVVDAVRATRVWQISDPEVTYVLAVHVEPYPKTVLAVWVYIGIQSVAQR